VNLIVKYEEHLIRSLDDTGPRTSIILEAYTSDSFIKTDDSNTTTWSTMGRNLTTAKNWDMLMTFSLPDLKKQKWSSWEFHVDDRFESSSTYDAIMGHGPRSSWRIRHNHKLQQPRGHLGY
jgi:hypothetical protein